MLSRKEVDKRAKWVKAHPPEDAVASYYQAACIAEREALETARQLAELIERCAIGRSCPNCRTAAVELIKWLEGLE
jgi:hypothetical protein